MSVPDQTTIRIYRDDRSKLDQIAKTPAKALRSLLCDHPFNARHFNGRTVVKHLDGMVIPVTIFTCEVCNRMIVLPGTTPEPEA
jgi:hypothetical protein